MTREGFHTDRDSRTLRRRLVIRITALAVTVGAAVAVLAALSGEGDCASPVLAGPADSECLALVRSLSERMGIVAALATAIIALTMMGLARLATRAEEPR